MICLNFEVFVVPFFSGSTSSVFTGGGGEPAENLGAGTPGCASIFGKCEERKSRALCFSLVKGSDGESRNRTVFP